MCFLYFPHKIIAMLVIRKICYALILMVPFLSIAQYQITIDAFVLDQETQKPIPFVNVKINEKNISSVSNKDGKIVLVYDEASVVDTDIISFSHLSYNTSKVKVQQLYKLLNNSNKIYLKAKPFLNKDLDQKHLTGTVFDSIGKIQGATVRVKNSLNETITDADGYFKIKANEDDVLVVSYLGMETREIQAIQEKTVSIELKSDAEILSQIDLAGKGKKELIETGYGKRDKDGVGVSVNTITSEEIGPQYNTLAQLLVGRFAGLDVAGLNVGYNTPRFIIRGGGGSLTIAFAMFDIDGIIYGSEQVVPEINLQNIEEITVLKSAAATNKYGTVGRGGAIVIKTKVLQKNENGKPVDTALIKGNEYEETVELIETVQKSSSIGINQLNKASSFEEAKKLFKALKQTPRSNNISFYMDASEYFMKWDKETASQILREASTLAFNNVKALKSIAYKLEELENFKDAKLLYQRVATLRPNSIQTYRDLASIYALSAEYNEAMKLYIQMLNNDMPNLDFSPIGTAVVNEVQNLAARHRQEVNYKDLHPVKWQHTLFDNKERLLDEIENGYHMEEYIIDDAESGEWIINIEALSKVDPVNPTYLKYTVYRDYGLPTEKKDVKVLKLDTKNQKVTLDKFVY